MLKAYVKTKEELGNQSTLDDTSFLASMMDCFEDQNEEVKFIAFCRDHYQVESLSTFIIYIGKLVDKLQRRDKLASYKLSKRNRKVQMNVRFSASLNVARDEQTPKSIRPLPRTVMMRLLVGT